MSSPPYIGSSQPTVVNSPRGFVYQPGFRAFAAGVKHAMLADNVLDTLGLYPNKKNTQQMAPIARQQRKGTMSKKTYKRKKTSPTTMVKKAILKMAQTYHDTVGDNTINSALVSNNFYGYNITAQCTQGTGLDERQGDAIHLIALKMKGSIFTPTTAGSYKYRVMVFFSGEEYNPATLGSAVQPSEIWLPSTAITFNIHGQVNNKAVTLLYDQVIDLNSTITGVSDVATLDFVIPLNQKFEYNSDNGVYGKTKNLYVAVTSVVGGGVSGTTSTGQILLSSDLLFKNL